LAGDRDGQLDLTGSAFRFAAFISYSHAADGRLAPALVTGLHRFAKPWYGFRALRVFHDQTSLAATPGLWGAIERALSSAEFFVLLASPEAATSPWVSKEVEYWLGLRPPETLLVALTGGEIVWDEVIPDFDWARTTALPRVLEGVFADEPRYIDLRWARTVEHLSVQNPHFRNAIADLAAPLHHRDKDTLIGDDVRQRRRTLRIAWSAVGLIVLLLVVATIAGVVALRQRDSARAAASRALADQAFTQLSVDPLAALRLAAEAGRSSLTPDAEAALRATLAGPLPRAILRGEAGPAGPAAISDRGGRLVTASSAGTARIWDTVRGETVLVLRGHTDNVAAANFSSDGSRVLTASHDKTVRLWDATRGTPLHVLRGHNSPVSDAEFSPDGSRVVTASNDARIWDSASGRQLRVYREHDSYVNSGAFSPDGNRIVTASDDSTARIWNVASGKTLRVLRGRRGHYFPLSGAVFSRNGKRVLASSEDGTTLIWDAVSGRILRTVRGRGVLATGDAVGPDGWHVVAFTDDGRLVVTVRGGNGRIWESAKTAPLRVLRGKDEPVLSVAFNGDGNRIVTTSGHSAQIWSAATGTKLRLLLGGKRPVYRAAFAPDGRHVLTSGRTKTTLWDPKTGRPLVTGHDFRHVDPAAFSDGRRIGLTFGDTTEIEDAVSNKVMKVLSGHTGRVRSAAFSPDGALVVTSSEDGTARIWDSRRGATLHVLRGHVGAVNDASFSPDGKFVVTAGHDGTARIWDVATGRALLLTGGNRGLLLAAAFSPDGRRIVIGGGDGAARVYRCGVCEPRGELLSRAAAVLARPGVKQAASTTG
jgi:WD40 repeat protein